MFILGNMDCDSTIDVGSSSRDLTACPDCGSPQTLVVRDVDLVAFVCEACGACWRIELGYLRRLMATEFSSGNDR